MNVLLLQGPIGPFFQDLRNELVAEGHKVTRVLFNRADALFYSAEPVVDFIGPLEEWDVWLNARLARGDYDLIIYFGCMRPAHVVAETVARRHGVRTYSLEEGYIRSGYITCEPGGNNLRSPILGKIPARPRTYSSKDPGAFRFAFLTMCLWGGLYYLWRSLFAREGEAEYYHRITRGPVREFFTWAGNSLRLSLSRLLERPVMQDLRTRRAKKFLLVPLQVPSDSQLQFASNGWTLDSMITAVIEGLARSESDLSVVFKIHPLDCDWRKRRHLIRKLAKMHGLRDRVRVLNSGSIGELCRNSDGVILVNSTSSFSAIHHAVPLLVLGKALCRNPALVTCGETAEDVDAFIAARQQPEKAVNMSYLQFVKDEALVPGDFYARFGRRVAARGVVGKLATSRVPARPITPVGHLAQTAI